MYAMNKKMAHSHNFILWKVPLSMKDKSMKAVLSKSKGKYSAYYSK